MSNFKSKAKRPGGAKFEEVIMLDGYFGSRDFGVKFPDGKIFPAIKCEMAPSCFNEFKKNSDFCNKVCRHYSECSGKAITKTKSVSLKKIRRDEGVSTGDSFRYGMDSLRNRANNQFNN